MAKAKKEKKVKPPEYFTSYTNIPTLNYAVYYMKPLEKILYALLAFAAGAVVGYIFYGGLAKDEFDNPTTLTYILNISISGAIGIFAAVMFIPMRTKSIINSRKRQLKEQFRELLDSLSTSLGSGKNVTDAFHSAYNDLGVLFSEDAYMVKELAVIESGMANNVAIEDMLMDLGKRSDIGDIESFANVFETCYRKGGNIKDVIKSTQNILIDKMEVELEIETIIASAKNELNIMCCMPIALVAIIKMMSPEFAANFATSMGIIATTVGVVLFVSAYLIGKVVMAIKI